jgi:hypothetical protein
MGGGEMREPIDLGARRRSRVIEAEAALAREVHERVAASHLRARFAAGMHRARSDLLVLDPEEAAAALTAQERAETGLFVAELRDWLDELERALSSRRMRVI